MKGMSRMIRVLIADDSAFMRKVLSDLFNKQSDFEVAGTAINGRDAIDKVKKLKPDVLTLDVNMPVMDGLEALAVIMEECPLPVVMFSSLTQRGTDATIRALALGAVDWISKAGGPISKIDPVQDEILTKCREAVQAHVGSSKSFSSGRPLTYTPVLMSASTDPPKMKRIEVQRRTGLKIGEKPKIRVVPTAPKAPSMLTAARTAAHAAASKKLVAIGTSTGGPQALQAVITRLPGNLPCGVVIVQHMPAGFTKSLAERLDSISAISVKEAENDEIIKPGQVYIAPGNYHMRVAPAGGVTKKITIVRQ